MDAVKYVAAADSSDADKARADYVCDGVDDDEEVKAAVASLLPQGGTVKFAAGNYRADAWFVPDGITFEGTSGSDGLPLTTLGREVQS